MLLAEAKLTRTTEKNHFKTEGAPEKILSGIKCAEGFVGPRDRAAS